MILLPASKAGVQDDRGRFREIFCRVLDVRADSLPDHRSCDEALTVVGQEPPGTGVSVALAGARSQWLLGIVPGLGWSCFAHWLDLNNSVPRHIEQFGYQAELVPVGALASTADNARDIRDWVLRLPPEQAARKLVLIGYSKGAPDILQALVTYPELVERVSAVVSIAGAIGGSPLANNAEQSRANLLTHIPGAECEEVIDRGAVDDLRSVVRQQWLAENSLSESLRYYSIVTYPDPTRISAGLKGSYRKISKVDARNDSQMIFYDQIIPGSSLLAYLNADHWAVAVPIARSHELIGSTFVNKNEYPREALIEALMRYLDEALPE
ncbi:MAG TPA: hypothetical protein VF190_16190 [Rhodothermales bacterium]